MQGESVVVRDQVDCKIKVAEPSTSTDPVEVGLGHLGEVEVDDNVDGLDVDTLVNKLLQTRSRQRPALKLWKNLLR